jgi:hypothetical protein
MFLEHFIKGLLRDNMKNRNIAGADRMAQWVKTVSLKPDDPGPQDSHYKRVD